MRSKGIVASVVLTAVAIASFVFPAVPSGAAAKKGDGSGGRAVAHYAGGKMASSPSLNRNAPEADLYPTGHDAVEPTLGQTKNGMVFFTAASSRNEVVRSNDGGKTWEVVSPNLGGQNIHAVSLDPYLYVDKWTNRVYTIDLLVACSLMSYTDDLGESWTTNPLACGRPVNDHQTLFSGPPVSSPTVGYDNIVYYCWNDVATSSCGKSLDGGLTWRATGSPAFVGADAGGQDEPEQCGGLHGHGVVGEDGTVYLPKEHCTQPWLAISKDEGTTWSQVRVSDEVAIWGPDPSVAVDAKGNIYYAFLNEDRLPYLTYSRNGGKTWSKAEMVGRPGITEAALATLDVGAPGKVALAYYATDDVEGKIEKRKYDQKVTWNGYMTISDNLFSKEPVFFSGNVNENKDPFARAACGPRRCYDALDFIDVVVGFDGTAWASFADSCVTVCAGTPGIAGRSGVVGRLVGGPSLR